MGTQLLLIDDEGQLRENIAELLTLKGYQVATASDGQAGILRAMRCRPDLIICDVMMPNLDGYQVLELVRSNRSLATVPFIFLTAKAETADVRQGMNRGADDYLTKPFLATELLTAIESRLAQEKRRITAVQAQFDRYVTQLGKLATHEYNTPLSGILGFAHLLADNYASFDNAQVQSMLAMVITCCERLKRTLDNTHLANCLLTGTFQVSPAERVSPLTLQAVNELVVAGYNQYERPVTGQLDIGGASLRIAWVDLHKIVTELIDNALKFSPSASIVRVRGRSLATSYQLSITNQGRGMTAAQIADVGPYTQFERAYYEQQGAGLGLFIVQRLAELNEGHLSITSQVGGETTVTVELPLVS